MPGTLFAAIDTPVPVQQKSTPSSDFPCATRSATAFATSGHGLESPAGGPKQLDVVPAASQLSLDEVCQTRPFVAAEGDAQTLVPDERELVESPESIIGTPL